MGTRSDIIVHRADGKWARSYCHWDGYLAGVGKTLFEHYTTQEKVDALSALGDMSVLDESIDKPEGHSFDNRVDGYTTFYGRDRGEKDVAATVGDSLEEVWPPEDTWTAFTYVWDEGQWFVADPDDKGHRLLDLGAALRGEKVIRPAVKAFGMILGHHDAAKVL